MAIVFDEEVKNIIRQVGRDELKPVPSVTSSKYFHHFNILRKKKRGISLHLEQPDIPTELTLMDILDPKSPAPAPSVDGPFIYENKVVKHLTGDITADANMGAELQSSGEIQVSSESILKFQTNSVTINILTDLISSRKILKPEPWYLKQFRDRKEDLYVVTETLVVTNSTEMLQKNRLSLLGKFSIPRIPYVTIKGQINSNKEEDKKLILQPGMVMAYKKKKLIIKKEGWELLLIKDEKQRTFQDEMEFEDRVLYEKTITRFTGEIKPIQTIEEPISINFKKLQIEISREMEAICDFSKEAQVVFFHNILAMLGDRKALLELQDMIDPLSRENLDGPGGIILNEIKRIKENSLHCPLSPILYLLEALMVLNDSQHDLLAWSVEKKILLHQRELVRSILEANFRYPWYIPFTLKPELLTPLWGDGLVITYGLLEECGLKIDQNSNRSIWHLDVKMPLTALYQCLSLLQQLTQA